MVPGSEEVARLTGDMAAIRLQLDNARQHIAVGSVVAEGVRFRFAKRLVLRLAHGITAEQAEYNRSMVEALTAIEARLAEVGQALLAVQASMATAAPGEPGALEQEEPGESSAGS